MSLRLRDIPDLYDIQQILTSSGVRLSGTDTNKWCICPMPFHAHSRNPTPSFSVFVVNKKQYFKCHGNCGVTGDVIDFIGYMEIPGYDKKDFEQRQRAAEILTGGEYKVSPPEIDDTPKPTLPSWLWETMLPPSPATVEYALSRGIGEREIEEFRIGTPRQNMMEPPYNLKQPSKWMAIPTFHHGELVGIKLRRLQKPGEKVRVRFLNVPGSGKGLHNHDAVYLSTGTVMVVKAEITAMVLTTFARKHNLPILACAPTGGEASYTDDLAHALALARVIVVGDNDPGEIGERTREMALRRAEELHGVAHFPPPGFKDLDDFIVKYPDDAVELIKDWISDVGN